MIAVLSPCVFRCRSRQLYDAFSSPSWNHLKNGAFDSSSTRVNGLCQSTCSFASRPQKPSKSRRSTCSGTSRSRSEEHTSELQSRLHLVCRLLLEKKKKT